MERFGEFLIHHWDLFLLLFVILGLIAFQFMGDRLRGYRDVEPGEAVQLMNRGGVVIDVREDREFREGHVTDALHVPLADLGQRLDKLEQYKGKPIIVGCRSGSRSARACGILRKHGFENVYNLRGGVLAWQNANLPLSREGKRRKR